MLNTISMFGENRKKNGRYNTNQKVLTRQGWSDFLTYKFGIIGNKKM